MKVKKYLVGIAMILGLLSCDKHIDDEQKQTFPILDNIVDTLWYSYDTKQNIYYDIKYYETTGEMLGYDTPERINEVVNRPFTYTFTPATSDIEAIVNVAFEDGMLYGGILIPKGNLQISNKEVYIIQLYEVDKQGYIIYDENGEIKSAIMMWKE